MFFRLSRRFITPASKLRNWGSPVFARFVSVKSHTTPNPNVKRYETFPEMVILPEAYGSSLEIKNVSQARVSPLAQLLLSLPEIRSVNMNSTSFSVAKKPSVSWEYIDSVLNEKLDKIS